MLSRILIAAVLAASTAAFAQAPQVQEPLPVDSAKSEKNQKNQKVENLHAEDNAVVIDEKRFAGQSESVTVQPKDGMPRYEIVPSNASRPPAFDDRRNPTPGGERVWNILHF